MADTSNQGVKPGAAADSELPDIGIGNKDLSDNVKHGGENLDQLEGGQAQSLEAIAEPPGLDSLRHMTETEAGYSHKETSQKGVRKKKAIQSVIQDF